MPDEPPRERVPSVHDVEQAAERGARAALEHVTGSHILASPTSTPPSLRWLDRRLGRLVRLSAKWLLAGAMTTVGAGVVGWLVRDCQAQIERAQPPPPPASSSRTSSP